MNSSAASLPDPAPTTPLAVPVRIFPDDLSLAEILAAESPPARKKRRSETSRSLGVYDADGDILDQYLYEVSRTPLLTVAQEIAVAKHRDGHAARALQRQSDADHCRQNSDQPESLHNLGFAPAA